MIGVCVGECYGGGNCECVGGGGVRGGVRGVGNRGGERERDGGGGGDVGECERGVWIGVGYIG